MSCARGEVNFRLLDANIGWSQDGTATVHLTGFSGATGIFLTQTVAGAVDPGQVISYLPPARLARGCGACEWYLITPAPPESLLLRRDACRREWHGIWDPVCAPDPFEHAVAVATWRGLIAVAERGANRIRIWSPQGARMAGEIALSRPGPMAFAPRGELLVTSENSPQIRCYGPNGEPRGILSAPLPAAGQVAIVAVDSKDGVWVVLDQDGSWTLWRAGRNDNQFAQAAIADLQNAFAPTGLLSVSSEGFCFDADRSRGLDAETCFSWYGRPLCDDEIAPLPPPQRQTRGQLITTAIDSGIARCEWHRIRVDADIPPGTTLSVAVATTEDPASSQGDPTRDPVWQDFPAGQPHFSDWTSPPTGSVDFLIQQPAGRYIYFRMRMTGNGRATPVVRRVRIDFPRATSIDHLPAVYRENPKAEDFTKRFLSLFDASIADVDDIITRYAALLDPTGIPPQLLPWLGGFFDIGFDPSWDATLRRQILQAAPRIYRLRGTLAGLQLAVETVFGVTPAIEQFSAVGPWGSVASATGHESACNTSGLDSARGAPTPVLTSIGRPARLRNVRLFGKARARFRLDHSSLGAAPLRSHGDPDKDPFADGAYRFRVLVPPLEDRSSEQIARLTNLIQAQSPAHTVSSIRVGGTGFLPGRWSSVGVDTAFVPLAAPILGRSGNIRLHRMSILWNGSTRQARALAVGHNSVVGTRTIAG